MHRLVTTRRWFVLFCSALAASAVALLLGLFYVTHIVREPSYLESTGDPFLAMQDRAFEWHDRRCEILIYGDSTAWIGLDPTLITARTGLSACNIAITRPTVDDVGMLPLDSFLEHNPKPRMLVLQFGPEDFYRSRSPWPNAGPIGPMVLLARNVPLPQALATMLSHPPEMTQFEFFVLQNEFFPKTLNRAAMKKRFDKALEHSRASNGQMQMDLPAEHTCREPALTLFGKLDTQWTRRLRAQYEARGIPVIIRLSPIPDCDPQFALFQHDLRPYADNKLEGLPIDDFVSGDRHPTQAGSQIDTLGLIELIKAEHPELLR
jgi:hypothetical protein